MKPDDFGTSSENPTFFDGCLTADLIKRVNMRTLPQLFFLSFLLISLNACALFIGSIKSTEEKSTQYSIDDLSKSHSGWSKVLRTADSELPDNARPDLIFESSRSNSVISITSACKAVSESSVAKNLTEETRVLLLGLTDLKILSTEKMRIDRSEALWTKVSGQMNQEAVRIETVVTRQGDCFYDLVLVGRSPLSEEDQKAFSDFVSTFHFKLK